MASGVVTTGGITAQLNASITGLAFAPSVVKVSSSIAACDGTETSLPNIVWTAPTSAVTQIMLSDNTFRTIVFMDTSVGTFTVGTICLYTPGGVLFALGAFPGAGIKIADNLPSVVGNIRTFYLDVNYADASNSITTQLQSITSTTLQAALSSGALTAGLMLAGSGPPGPSLGTTGDFYLDQTSKLLYGPKTSTGWGGGLYLGV